MSNYPKISIITPVKNAVGTLEKAIQSLIAQNYPNLEYIVIDGASTDGTIDIIKKYDKYITHWESNANENNAEATLNGISKSSGEIVAFLNADDFYESNILNKIAAEFINHPEMDIISCLYRTIDSKDNTLEESSINTMKIDKNKIIEDYGINARFFRKNLFSDGILSKDNKKRYFISNDIEYMIRFALKGVKNKTIDHIGYNYLSHEGSISFSSSFEKQIQKYEDKIFIAQKFLSENKNSLPKIWQKTFKKWIKKYRAKIAVRYLKIMDLRNFAENFLLGIKENKMRFILYFLKSLPRK